MKIAKSISLKSTLPYVFLLLLSFGVFLKPIADLDELWNYNFARCIYDGLSPYVDFNILTTPLAPYISSFFLFLCGNSLFTFRIAAFCLLFATFAVFYKLCTLISDNKALAFGFTMIVFALNISRWIFNYNYLILLLLLCAVFLEYLRAEKGTGSHVLFLNAAIGLIIGLVPLAKQSTGLIFVFANGVICLYEWLARKTSLKGSLLRISCSILPSALFVFVLLISNNFINFYDYCIAGIGGFSHSITYFDYILSSPITFVVGLIPVIAVISFGICFFKNKLKVRKQFALALFVLSCAGSVVAFPLCDSQHFPVALAPFVLCLLCCDIKLPFRKKWLKRAFCCICAVVALFIALAPSVLVFSSSKYVQSELLHYEHTPISNALEKEIITINKYIEDYAAKGVKVYIADSTAAVYMIPLDRYNKNFDLLLLGNLGTYSIQELLEDKTDSIILIRKDESTLNYQSHKELLRYIKSNYQYVEDIQAFEAYLIK